MRRGPQHGGGPVHAPFPLPEPVHEVQTSYSPQVTHSQGTHTLQPCSTHRPGVTAKERALASSPSSVPTGQTRESLPVFSLPGRSWVAPFWF